MAKVKFYAVRNGVKPGIYNTWDECKAQVSGYSGAEYKSFATLEEAQAYVGLGNSESNDVAANVILQEPWKEKIQEDIKNGYLVAYTDGSYDKSSGKYSYGIVIIDEKLEEKYLKDIGENPEYAKSHNVAGELLAALTSIAYAISTGRRKIKIYHDYEGVAKWITGEWQAKMQVSKDYLKTYNDIKEMIEVQFEHVKGHSNNPYNEKADQLAKEALKEAAL